MLVLTRKKLERIHVSPDITIVVVAIRGSSVRIGIEAPPGTRVDRMEVHEARKGGTQHVEESNGTDD